MGAATNLGIPRQTLESKIKTLGIDKHRFKAPTSYLSRPDGENRQPTAGRTLFHLRTVDEIRAWFAKRTKERTEKRGSLSRFPLTAREIGEGFSLQSALAWGTLPRPVMIESDADRRDFLRSYAHTYLQEEITQEQIVRRLDPFRRFLIVAAQMSGQILNFTKIAREIGSSTVTVQSYFQILEDTLIGNLVEPFHESVHKRPRGNPKFYFFDIGVQRALNNTL